LFVFLSKLLPTLIYPLGLASLMMIVALILRRWLRLQSLILVLALLLLWLGGNRWVANGLALSLESQYRAPDPVPKAEVLVVLGGGTNPAESPRQMVELNGAGDRVLDAVRLYREGKAKYILASGGVLEWEAHTSTPAEDMAFLLEWMGVPKEAIWLQNKSQNTYEDALYCAQILKEKGIDRILLVTSAWHMPRSVKLFEAQGLSVIPVPTDYNVTQASWERTWKGGWQEIALNLFPSASNLSMTSRMLKEYLGLFVYGLRGWLG
jgi:uncharacterized SAM-binding protein YcdF (DUF218 family)